MAGQKSERSEYQKFLITKFSPDAFGEKPSPKFLRIRASKGASFLKGGYAL